MKKSHLIFFGVILSIVLVATTIAPAIAAAPAQSPFPKPHVALPFEEEGIHGGARYKISVPENWNGTLIVYAHEFHIKLTPDGNIVFVIPDPTIAPGNVFGNSIENELLEAGYALAGSSFSSAGWAVKEGIQDTVALTTYFNGRVGKPKHTILWGLSMGGLIAMELAEQSKGIYDGVVVEGWNGIGATSSFDGLLNVLVVYGAIFGWPEQWGSPGDLKSNIDWATDVLPVVVTDIYTPSNFGKAEFFRLLLGQSVTQFYYEYGWLIPMFYCTVALENFQHQASGNPLQNIDLAPLALSPADIAYLGTLGINAQDILDQINSTKIEASPSARNYLEHYATPGGDIKVPMIQVHAVNDTYIPVAGTIYYKNLVNGAGKSSLLLQVYTGCNTGHANLTKPQYLQTISAMQEWVETGTRPDPDDYFKASDCFVPYP